MTDLSGNGRHGTVLTATGLNLVQDQPGTFGIGQQCPRALPYVNGTGTTQLRFGGNLPTTFSFCTVMRRVALCCCLLREPPFLLAL